MCEKESFQQEKIILNWISTPKYKHPISFMPSSCITHQIANKAMCKGLGRVPSEGYCEDKWLMSALPAAQLITVIENILRENTAYSY